MVSNGLGYDRQHFRVATAVGNSYEISKYRHAVVLKYVLHLASCLEH